MAQTSQPSFDIPTRRLSFDAALSDLPKHFAADGDLIQSHLAAALSGVFPDGEDFFVASVRHYRDQITDPDLRRQVNGFIGQESMHGRTHRAFNERLAALGYPTKFTERRIQFLLRQQQRFMSPERQLALTAALEHFTATLAELTLRDERTRELLGHEAVRQLFVWHALEESEHKAVAFDVYRAVGGSEKLRVRVMRQVRVVFVASTALQVMIAVLADPASRRRGALKQSLQRFHRSPLWDRAVWQRLKDYDRYDFHPNDHDTVALVEEWRTMLFGESGELNDLLAGSAA